MKKRISTVFVIYIGFILQTTVFYHLRLAGVGPNIILVITVLTAYMRGQTDGLFTGLVCGLVSDMLFGNILGLYAIILMVIGYLVGYANRIYYSDDFTIPLILVGVSNLVYSLLFYMVEFLLRGRTNLSYYFIRIMFPEMVYTLVIAVIVFKFLHVLEKRLTPNKEEEV